MAPRASQSPSRVTIPADREVVWKPHPGPQTRFLASSVYELLYGGAAGGGKSQGLLAGPLRWIQHPSFRAVLHRRTYKQLVEPRGLWECSHEIYGPLGARPNASTMQWRWPSGAVIGLMGLEHLSDAYAVRGEIQYLGFDELNLFERAQYLYRLTRGRSAFGIPIRVRSSTNPEPGWVKDRWAPWVDRSPEYLDKVKRGLAVIAQSGQVLWYLADKDGTERYVPQGTPGALSRQFISAKLTDNPTLLKNDPGYLDRLNALDAVTRERLKEGNWEARPAKGLYFRRSWCGFCDRAQVPTDARFCRFWDRASTDESAGGNPDWTAGVLLARKGPEWWICDALRERKSPAGVDSLIKVTAAADELAWGRVELGSYQDPGQAGVDQAKRFLSDNAGRVVRTLLTSGNRQRNAPAKVQHFEPFSVQAEHHNVTIVRGSWNAAYLGSLESFPEGDHDDFEDATSGGFRLLTMREPRAAVMPSAG